MLFFHSAVLWVTAFELVFSMVGALIFHWFWNLENCCFLFVKFRKLIEFFCEIFNLNGVNLWHAQTYIEILDLQIIFTLLKLITNKYFITRRCYFNIPLYIYLKHLTNINYPSPYFQNLIKYSYFIKNSYYLIFIEVFFCLFFLYCYLSYKLELLILFCFLLEQLKV